MQRDIEKRSRKAGKLKIKADWKWITSIFGITIGISATMSLLSNEGLSEGGLLLSFGVLLLIILIGVVFDIIGVAVTAADEKPFHSMAAKKMPEATEAIRLLRKAERVSSFCNDVVGDICGVISGSASAVIAAQAVIGMPTVLSRAVQLLMSALVAGITVGGKASGNSIAMSNSTAIIHTAARLIYSVKSAPKRLMRLIRHK